MKTNRQNEKKPASKFAPVKTGSGVVTGHLEVFLSRGGLYVSVPGVSRFKTAVTK